MYLFVSDGAEKQKNIMQRSNKICRLNDLIKYIIITNVEHKKSR